MKNIIITGGAGFIGSHVVREFVKNNPDSKIINLDALTYAGNLENLKDIENEPNYVFEKADITKPEELRKVFEKYNPDAVVHLAAESTVDEKVNIYLNRLSDYLFTLARKLGNEQNIPENQWIPRL